MQAQLRFVDHDRIRLQFGWLEEHRRDTDESEQPVGDLPRPQRRVSIIPVVPLQLDTLFDVLAIHEISKERRGDPHRLHDILDAARMPLTEESQKRGQVAPVLLQAQIVAHPAADNASRSRGSVSPKWYTRQSLKLDSAYVES